MCCPFPPAVVRTQIAAAKRTASTQNKRHKAQYTQQQNHSNHTKAKPERVKRTYFFEFCCVKKHNIYIVMCCPFPLLLCAHKFQQQNAQQARK